jgi:hypothetical protein
MELGIIMILSKISQSQKDKYQISHMWNLDLKNKHIKVQGNYLERARELVEKGDMNKREEWRN